MLFKTVLAAAALTLGSVQAKDPLDTRWPSLIVPLDQDKPDVNFGTQYVQVHYDTTQYST